MYSFLVTIKEAPVLAEEKSNQNEDKTIAHMKARHRNGSKIIFSAKITSSMSSLMNCTMSTNRNS